MNTYTSEIHIPYTEEHKKFLLSLARNTLKHAVKNLTFEGPDPQSLDPILKEPKAVFVTLTKHGELRGCIGTLTPVYPLYKAVMNGAISAAFEDPRFLPVTETELSEIKIEISILTNPTRLDYKDSSDLLQKLRPHVDGVIFRYGPYSATFLPQVWEKLPNKEDFLSHLCLKAGVPANTWQNPKSTFDVYQVISFEEF